MRRMLDLTDVKDVVGKKLYKHRIQFNYVGAAGAGAGVSGRYVAIIITPREAPYDDSTGNGVEQAVMEGMFLRGQGIEVAGGKQYVILALPDGGDTLVNFILVDLTNNIIVNDDNEEFITISDTVSEWN